MEVITQARESKQKQTLKKTYTNYLTMLSLARLESVRDRVNKKSP